MNATTTTDWAILDFLSAHPQPIRSLVDRYPKATIYARLRALLAAGLVAKRGRQYLLTTAGLQATAAHDGGQAFDGLVEAYPPLREVPSPQHQALAELEIGALVLRQLTDQDEHHAGFLLVGPSLTWKSSSGRFLCLTAGADPATCLVDLAAEAGRSLWVRRDATGDIRSQRGLLSAAVVVLDEYGLADRAVRQAVLPLLSGRRRVPLENDVLPITPVPIITMNPRAGQSLTARTGFSLPQLRRLVPCDLGAVPLPDLALTGARALDAARAAGPLTLRAPTGSCEACRQAVVRLLRQVLVPDAVGIVDVELLLGLGRGLTGWLGPAMALRQVLYDFLLVVETVGWVRSGWLDVVRAFPHRGQDADASVGGRGSAIQPAAPTPPPQTISLFPERVALSRPKEHPTMNARDSVLPTFLLSERSKAQLVWLAENAGIPLDEVVSLLIEQYRMQQEFDDPALDDLRTVVRLREACGAAEITARNLRTAVEFTAGLRQRGLTLDDIQPTLQVAADLADDHHGRAAPGRDHAGQRLGESQRCDLLPGAGCREGGDQRARLPLRDVPDGADHAAERARPAGAGRPPGFAREDQPGAHADHRPAHQPVGGQGDGGGGQERGPTPGHAARHVQAGRGRAGAARQGDQRRRGVQAAAKLAEAAEVLSRHPIAVQLRYLQTMREVASERNTTTFFPLPLDLFTPLLKALGATPPPKS
jgi:hypothetical protein